MDVWERGFRAVVAASTEALVTLTVCELGSGGQVPRGGIGPGTGAAVYRGGVERARAERERVPFHTYRVGSD